MADAYLTSPDEDLELLRACAVNAGLIASGYFRRDMQSWTKENSSPVTEADIQVDRFLGDALLSARPDYGWLSEESLDDGGRLTSARSFIVDPIDGTRGFMQGDDRWTVSLAVVEDGVAIAGVVYAPARDELYDAYKDGGARLNGKPLRRKQVLRHGPLIPAPGAVHQELQAAGLDYVRGPYMPSLAYRLVQVATGALDAAVVRRGSHDWDLAGAAVILAEAGINFEDVCSGTVRLNRADVRHGALAAVFDTGLKPIVHEVLRKVYGCPDEVAAPSDEDSSDAVKLS